MLYGEIRCREIEMKGSTCLPLSASTNTGRNTSRRLK
jgi:hypothetical protein